MSREHCPNCYLRAKESGYVDLYTLEREEDGTLVCPSCGEEYTDSEVDEKWYDIEFEERIEEESAIEHEKFVREMIEEGKMNSAGEWIDEDGYPVDNDWYDNDYVSYDD